jgi:RNA polymerase sigma factor (sigma-70 family)
MGDAEVYQEVRFELIRLATALVGTSDAEDVVSTVIARALERRGGLAGLDEPRPYLIKAVINEARSRFRKRQTTLSVAEVREELVIDDRDEIVDVITSLPPQQRAAVFLVYWEGHTAVSASKLMGCRPATVRRYLHLARRKLEAMLDV